MLKREIVVPPEHLYPPDEWRVVEARYAAEFFERAETIFSLGNGLYVDDEPLFVPTARVRDYARVLDMRAGTLTREFVWITAAGKHVRVRSCRIVSLEHRHVIAMTYEVSMLDTAAPVAISSLVLNRQDSHPAGDRPEHGPGDPRSYSDSAASAISTGNCLSRPSCHATGKSSRSRFASMAGRSVYGSAMTKSSTCSTKVNR
jgi:alpha,alpha-trehalose phosphorylase